MTTTEKYAVLCITVMTLAYLWLIRKYAIQMEHKVFDDPEDVIPYIPQDSKPFVKGLDDEQ